jgi:hypothetical protein
MKFTDRIRLALLRGEDNRLHGQIAGGYARGRSRGDLVRKQQEVRAEIRRMTNE